MPPLTHRRRLSSLAAAVVLMASPALADWEADVRVKSTPLQPGQKASPDTTGRMYGRKGQLRLDVEFPMQPLGAGRMSFIFDWEKGTAAALLHAQKLANQRKLEDMPVPLPGPCLGPDQDYDACLKAQGYKKVGTGKVSGHPTTIYERRPPGAEAKTLLEKVWRPTDLPEVPYVRGQTFDARDKVMVEMVIFNIKTLPQPDSRFAIPPDYQLMEPEAPNDMQGHSRPEELKGETPGQNKKP